MTLANTEALELVGYFPRNTAVPAGWSSGSLVTEVCSVSTCLNAAPDGWMNHWLHNELGFYNTLRDAQSILPVEAKGFTLFAYRLLPARFQQGQAEAVPLNGLAVEPLPAPFASIGFDVVSKSITPFFECSPLSCNGMAEEVAVNRYCLIETLQEALTLAERFSREEPEPGPYYVVEVLRQAPSAALLR